MPSDPAVPKKVWVTLGPLQYPARRRRIAGKHQEAASRHYYFHKIYVPEVVLKDLNKPTKAPLEKAMKGHILEKVELIGTYRRGG